MREGWVAPQGAFAVDPGLPPHSRVWDIAFPERHILVRPFIPGHATPRYRAVPDTDPALPLERRTIEIPGRDSRHPVVWGWILAIREWDLELEPSLRPGAMVIFKRHANEPLDFDAPSVPQWLGQRLDIHLIHIEAVEAAFNPALVEQTL